MSTPEDKTPEEQPEAVEPEATEPVAEEQVAEETAAEEETPAEEPVAEEAPKPRRRRRGAAAETPAPAPAPTRSRSRTTAEERPVVRASARYVRTSARKARLVCDLLRGKSVQEARAILAFSERSVARDWSKVLESAIANAEHNHELVGDDLRILTASAD
jgi:ribosomal protein L22